MLIYLFLNDNLNQMYFIDLMFHNEFTFCDDLRNFL